ncbi:MAG TPA: hypothetical protein ENI87_13340 [bacterium]|nr:hypothetical protein [bacterium]
MQLETKKYLFDAQKACARVAESTAGKSFSDYSQDSMLKAAVERQFEIAGEARESHGRYRDSDEEPIRMIRELYSGFDPERPLATEDDAKAWVLLCHLRGSDWFREYSDRFEDYRRLGISAEKEEDWFDELRDLFAAIATGAATDAEVTWDGGLVLLAHCFRERPTERALENLVATTEILIAGDVGDLDVRLKLAAALVDCFDFGRNPGLEPILLGRRDLAGRLLDQAEHCSRPRRRMRAREIAGRIHELRKFLAK